MTVDNLAFVECAQCSALPGSPVLCPSCLHNRTVVETLRQKLRLMTERAERQRVTGFDHGWDARQRLMDCKAIVEVPESHPLRNDIAEPLVSETPVPAEETSLPSSTAPLIRPNYPSLDRFSSSWLDPANWPSLPVARFAVASVLGAPVAMIFTGGKWTTEHHDSRKVNENLAEILYWEFDADRKTGGEERLKFKHALGIFARAHLTHHR